jgi:hypothetical protein
MFHNTTHAVTPSHPLHEPHVSTLSSRSVFLNIYLVVGYRVSHSDAVLFASSVLPVRVCMAFGMAFPSSLRIIT